jgi:hypothetical protein
MPDTLFKKGRTKTGGRPPGGRNKQTLRRAAAALEGDGILSEIVRKAKEGSVEHEKLYVRALLPRPETFLGPFDYTAPVTVDDARLQILTLGERVVRGELSVEAHDVILKGLRLYLGDVAAEEQLRLAAIKKYVVVENTGPDLPLAPGDTAIMRDSAIPLDGPRPPGLAEPGPGEGEQPSAAVLPFPQPPDAA